MPKALHDSLKRQADKKGLKGKRRDAYIYGTLQKYEKKHGKKKADWNQRLRALMSRRDPDGISRQPVDKQADEQEGQSGLSLPLLAALGIPLATGAYGGTKGYFNAPEGYGIEGATRGASRGFGGGAGAVGGAALGGAGAGGLADYLTRSADPNVRQMAVLASMLAGGAGGGLLGHRLGKGIAKGRMGAAPWAYDEEKQSGDMPTAQPMPMPGGGADKPKPAPKPLKPTPKPTPKPEQGGMLSGLKGFGQDIWSRISALPWWGKALLAASPVAAYGLYRGLSGRNRDEDEKKYGVDGARRIRETERAAAVKVASDFFDALADRMPLNKQAAIRLQQSLLARGFLLDRAVDTAYPEKTADDRRRLVSSLCQAIHKFACLRAAQIKQGIATRMPSPTGANPAADEISNIPGINTGFGRPNPFANLPAVAKPPAPAPAPVGGSAAGSIGRPAVGAAGAASTATPAPAPPAGKKMTPLPATGGPLGGAAAGNATA